MEGTNDCMMTSYPDLSDNALVILERRYLLRNEQGKVIETPDMMFERVSKNVASANDLYKDGRDSENEAREYFDLMRGLEFLPNSPTLMNAGTSLQQLAACFVLPVEDSIEGIYDAVKWAAIIHQSGGGTGFSFSHLRPAGDIVRSTMGIASGPVSFMKVFDAATEAIKQGGRRRGASMGILRVDHPDIMSFIHCKDDLKALTNFNISVGTTDKFMEAARKGAAYDLINPRTGESVGAKNASEVLNEICSSAWRSGDPGLVFLDTINRYNPTPGLGNMESTNPCGEVPLLPFEACNLGSINLDRMLTAEDGLWALDWSKLEKTIDASIRFLDNIIDVGHYPLPRIRNVVLGNRKIGLGIMGFADALLKLNIRYGSEESLAFIRQLMAFIKMKAIDTSAGISRDRGDFPNIAKSIYQHGRRNATVLSIAPTGTISMIAGCSSGIEPLYAISYVKHVMDGTHLREIHPYFLEMLKKYDFLDSDLENGLARAHSIASLTSVPESVRRIFVTAYDVPPEDHVRVQSVFQAEVDNAVSKTINLPIDSTPHEVRRIYDLAHRLGCKGITVYREGSRPGQVLTLTREVKVCPDCGSSLRYESGSFVCEVCGYLANGNIT
jgi:ribonucleoside-diphosphate reductase alpha chain